MTWPTKRAGTNLLIKPRSKPSTATLFFPSLVRRPPDRVFGRHTLIEQPADFDVTLRGDVAAQGSLRFASIAAYVGAPTMMERASLFGVCLSSARSPTAR
jgi:hypothetical protein